ncbi:MAG TPA: SusD/RagB family nutrient-binding outer membrane lipoprotein [Chitinophagaceae bacterium]|nr:SusD/RagB family nutrient-binding outer membrane lipoprotein [Chitinophagaceae bacterium]
MKSLSKILYTAVASVILFACNKQIQEKQANPNNPTSVPPGLILGTVLTDISGTGSQGSLGGINSWDNVQDWNQYHCQNYDYYGNNIYSWTGDNASFDPYLVVKNVMQMENEALSRGAESVNPYEAVGRFVRAYYYYNLTSLFGDVPQTDALQGSKNSSPAYTPQEQVFTYVLNELDTANADFTTLIANNDNSLSASQDIFYGGDLSLWQKVVNTFKLRVLIALSNKSSDATLNVPAQFANIFNNPSRYPVFTSQDDDFRFVYNPGGSNTYSTYPFNPSNYGSIAARFNMAKTYVSALTSLSDPRVFVTCEPAGALWDTTQSPCQFKYFVGASTGEPVQTMYANASAGLYSFINRKRYYADFTGEPDVLVGYKEMCFNIAEAIERGWIAGNAETWYKTGITESMKFYGINPSDTSFDAYFLPPGANSVTQVRPYNFKFYFDNYYGQSAVKLSSTPSAAIDQIVMQKYISLFENSGYEAYYNWRRTGVPAFESGAGVGNNGVIPLRWAYPVSEQAQNAINWNAAISAQQFSQDDLNQKMWLLK